MCGIVGIWHSSPLTDSDGTAKVMVAALRHRGPDAQGYWSDEGAGVALGHARLSIVELSPAGAQPFVSASGRLVLVYNGEIYNHMSLRKKIEERGGFAWRGHSDTETLLALIETYGVEDTVKQLHGMFAFAVWDRQARCLTLARDRFGEKPLYYSSTPKGFAFASELKALMRAGVIDPTLSRNAAAALLRYNHIPAPYSVFDGVQKLDPGHILSLDCPTGTPVHTRYWSVFDAWQAGSSQPFEGTSDDAINELERQLAGVIRGQMMADVPLGAFLSGGIDSSVVVALMQRAATQPIKTFSIGFSEKAYNEADSAKAVAKHLGTDHHELYLTPRDALEVIPSLPEIYCEPFADSSQIPTYLVARFARGQVTVALTGDGGDEVFGGYNRYLFGTRVYEGLRNLPLALRRGLAALLDVPTPQQWDRFGALVRRSMPTSWRFQDPGDKVSKLSRALPFDGPSELYESFLYQWWPDPETAVPGASSSLASSRWNEPCLQKLSFAEQMMVQDAIAYLPNDILVKLDRATMAASIEGRVPFLDHGLYEFAASLPIGLKIHGGQTKWVLKKVLHRHVPKALVDRAKTGFGVPIERWLRGELRDWAEALLSTAALSRVGVFDPKVIRNAWAVHLSERRNLQHPLWCVLMYQAWHERWIGAQA